MTGGQWRRRRAKILYGHPRHPEREGLSQGQHQREWRSEKTQERSAKMEPKRHQQSAKTWLGRKRSAKTLAAQEREEMKECHENRSSKIYYRGVGGSEKIGELIPL